MPTYIYKCATPDCPCEFEVLQSFSDDPLVFCPHCGKNSLEKQITLPYVIIKQSYNQIKDARLISERNIQSIGKEQYQKMVEQYGKKEPTKQWYHDPSIAKAPDKQVAKMTPKQQKDYIVEGKVPS